MVRQLSVFLENKKGRVNDILSIISDSGINIVSVSLADTSDFGILRLLCNAPEEAHNMLKEKGITSKITDVVAVCVPHEVGSLKKVIYAITNAGISINYIYGLSLNDDGASIAMKTSDHAKTIEVLNELGVKMFNQEDL
ncbi:MAG: ACT domain-containing protein [Lachnospiraceae bacterium]|nr:ACT domain-containing protein [Lachnospiraceae bacterium]